MSYLKTDRSRIRKIKRNTKKININTDTVQDQEVQRETTKIGPPNLQKGVTGTIKRGEDGHQDLVVLKSSLFRRENEKSLLKKNGILDQILPCTKKECIFLSKVEICVANTLTRLAHYLRLKRRLMPSKCNRQHAS